MRLAYLILAHKSPNQLKRLVRAIYHPGNYYLIHMDVKSGPECHRAVREIVSQYPQVREMKSRNCRWGGFSVLHTELQAIEELLQWTADWDFFINLSGQDFPLQSQQEITSYLHDRAGHNFMWVHNPLESGIWPDAIERVEGVYLEIPHRPSVLRLPRINIDRSFMLNGATWYGGATWCILSSEFCRHVVFDKAVRKFRRFLRHTLLADESFFQTVIMNSEYRGTLVNDYKRQISWPDGPTPHPKTYTAEDYDELRGSDAFFARKFDETVDSLILDKLEQDLRGRSPSTYGRCNGPHCDREV